MTAEGLLIFIFLLFLLVLGGRLLISPLTWFWRVLVRGIYGLVMLLIFNTLAGFFGYILPLNPYTVLYCGFLGLPGLLSLCYLKSWL